VDTGAYIQPSALILHSLSPAERPKTVIQAISYVQKHLFCPLPENFKGLSASKVAEILQFRERIPPYVPRSLVNTLLGSNTMTAKEIARLSSTGVIRQLQVSSRERRDDGGIVPTDYLYSLIRNSELNIELQEKFVKILQSNPTAPELPGYLFDKEEVRCLMDSGFLTMPSSFVKPTDSQIEGGGKDSLVKSSSAAASGTAEAVGGKGIVTNMGYASGLQKIVPGVLKDERDYVISLPTLGPLLAVFNAGREYLMDMIKKEKKSGGETEKVLRERWDGGARIWKCRKWKELKGLNWEGAAGDCLGRGECEVIEAVGVGLALRQR
jgi:hypothetical protein